MAVTLYTLGLSIRAIARLIGVSPTAVLKWIKTFAKTHYEKPAPGDAIIVELDEMWHYLGVEYQHVVHPPLRHDAGGLLPRAEWGRTKL